MNHLNSVRQIHLHHGLACDFLNSFSLALTKKGLKRIMGTKSRQKHSITVNLLWCMRTVLDLSIPTQAALWCLFLVAFFSFLRKSSLTTSSGRAFNPSKHLTLNDIKFSRNGAVLRIHWSKTLQHREGILLIPLPIIPNSDLCPVTAVHHYFQLVPADANSPFFCVPQGPILQPITFSLFSSFLKETISAIVLDATNFSLNSFGWGGATHAYQSGVPDHLIKLHGDWRSDAYKLYLSLPLATCTRVADVMAASLFNTL